MYIKPKVPRGSRRPRCPHPNCPANQEPYTDPWDAYQCTLNEPIWMVIPPEGTHISCPVHPEGHHIYGSPAIWMENNLPDPANKPWCEYDHDSSKDLTYDSTRPYGTATGFAGRDTTKFSM